VLVGGGGGGGGGGKTGPNNLSNEVLWLTWFQKFSSLVHLKWLRRDKCLGQVTATLNMLRWIFGTLHLSFWKHILQFLCILF